MSRTDVHCSLYIIPCSELLFSTPVQSEMTPRYYLCMYLSFLLCYRLAASKSCICEHTSSIRKRTHAGQHIQLVEQPSTLLLPVNKSGTFSCKAQCDHYCAAFWVLNNSMTLLSNTTRMHYSVQFQGNTSLALTLTVNASSTLNNTGIACRYEPTGDRHGIVQSNTTAVLLVLSGKYITPIIITITNFDFNRTADPFQPYSCQKYNTCDFVMVASISMAWSQNQLFQCFLYYDQRRQ